MKVILAPTDFSKHAHKAVNYAARLAMLVNARLVLLHAFSLPVSAGEDPVAKIGRAHV